MGSDTLTVTVNNVAPIVNAGADQTADEGDTVIFNGSFTDPGSADTHTYSWDFGDGTPPVEGTLTPTHLYPEDGDYTVTLTVTDDDGGVGSDTLLVTVGNMPPDVNAGDDQTANEGDTVTFGGSFFDPGDAGTHSVTWDFGDGAPPVAGTLTPTHVFADNGVYTVTLTVADDDGGIGTDTLKVTVANVDPAVDAGPDQSADEGDTVIFNGSFTDPGSADTHTVTWDFGDGTAPVSGTLTPAHVYADNRVYAVTLTVVDDDGGIGTDSLMVTVNNVAPTVDAGPDQTVDEGDTVIFNGSFTDPGSADTHTITWDFGDGTAPVSGTLTPAHVYADNKVYAVTLTVVDDDGGIGTDSLMVTVGNLPPVVEAGGDLSADEGDTVAFAGSFTDPGTADTHTVVWDFGDGASAPGTLTPTHVYADNGVYTVTLIVTDDDGSVGSDTLTVTVNNVAPTVNAGADQSANEGDTVTFGGSFTDPGSADTHTATIDWGEGAGPEAGIVNGAAGTVSGDHVYAAAGTYTVTVTVTDDDGGTGSDTLTVTVEGGAPPVCGDLDHDGDVDGDDRNVLRSALNACTGDARFVAEADYDGNGCITYNDYRMWYTCYRDFIE